MSEKDLTGKVFGELTAVRPTGDRYHGGIVWECRCSCGKMCYVPRLSLMAGQTKSCGHIKYDDLQGMRFSRLVAIRPSAAKSRPKTWLCRCDCGGTVLVKSNDLKSGNTKSCGCLSRKNGIPYAKCPVCGDRFPIVLDGRKTPQFCSACEAERKGRAWRVCPICKKLFPAPPSSNAVTCSKECSAQWKSIVHRDVSNRWTYESKTKLSECGQTNNLKLGTAAAQQSPISGPFETNQEAKIWVLIDPAGKETTVRNLLKWARENTELFDKPPGDRSARQISAGFRQIAQTMAGNRGAPGKPRGAMYYFGWTLKKLPETPEPER